MPPSPAKPRTTPTASPTKLRRALASESIPSAFTATVLRIIPKPQVAYPRCSACFRKLALASNQMPLSDRSNRSEANERFECPVPVGCGRSCTITDVQYRYIITLGVSMGGATFNVTVFGSTLDSIIGCSATRLHSMHIPNRPTALRHLRVRTVLDSLSQILVGRALRFEGVVAKPSRRREGPPRAGSTGLENAMLGLKIGSKFSAEDLDIVAERVFVLDDEAGFPSVAQLLGVMDPQTSSTSPTPPSPRPPLLSSTRSRSQLPSPGAPQLDWSPSVAINPRKHEVAHDMEGIDDMLAGLNFSPISPRTFLNIPKSPLASHSPLQSSQTNPLSQQTSVKSPLDLFLSLSSLKHHLSTPASSQGLGIIPETPPSSRRAGGDLSQPSQLFIPETPVHDPSSPFVSQGSELENLLVRLGGVTIRDWQHDVIEDDSDTDDAHPMLVPNKRK